jgi:HlyD family secretion protein
MQDAMQRAGTDIGVSPAVDIALHPQVLKSRAWQTRGRWLVAAASLLAALLWLRHWLTPSVSRDQIRTAKVERGPVSTEVKAAGTVVPVSERVLISPVTSTIAEVYLPLGSKVRRGDPILRLDSTQIEQQIARITDQLRLKDLELEGLGQQQRRALQELRSREALARLDLQNQQVILERYEKLVQSNVVSRFDYDTARLNAHKTQLQLEQLARQVVDSLQSDSNALKQQSVQRQLLAQQLTEAQTLRHDTTLRASSDGIITVLLVDIGGNVAAGAELARISDLSSYRVDATLSDFYLHQISAGMLVTINLGADKVAGRVDQILPAVDNGTIRLRIALDDPGNALLKPNLRTEASIVTASRDSGLRVTNGVVFNGTGPQDVFVVRDGKAVKRRIVAGLTNASHVEIVSGLVAGDEIVISDMTAWKHLDSMAIDN